MNIKKHTAFDSIETLLSNAWKDHAAMVKQATQDTVQQSSLSIFADAIEYTEDRYGSEAIQKVLDSDISDDRKERTINRMVSMATKYLESAKKTSDLSLKM